MKPGRNIAAHARAAGLISAFALLFFLAASAPHRVHHAFESPAPAENPVVAHGHDHSDTHSDDHNQAPPPSSAQPDCVVLAAAQQSHIAAVHGFTISLVGTALAYETIPTQVRISLRALSPRSQRAPPLV